MSRRFKQTMVDHLERESKKLTSEQIDNLLNLKQIKAKSVRPYLKYISAIAVSIVLLALVSFPFVSTDKNIAWQIADEVAMNHLYQRPLEVKGRQLAQINDYFAELSFELLESSILQSSLLQLDGGRYCSVRGNIAAQLRLKNTDGEINTIYQVPYNENEFGALPDVEKGESPLNQRVRGLDVDIWVEKGLLFSLVKKPTE